MDLVSEINDDNDYDMLPLTHSYIVSKFGEPPSNDLGVYAVKTHNFRPQLDDDLQSSRWRFETLEDHNFDSSRVIGNHFCTPCRNL